MDGYSFQFDQCISLNFGYHDDQLSIPQLSMTPDYNRKLDFDSPSICIFVVIGGKYLNMIGKVMDSIGITKTIAVFLMSKNNYQDNVVIDVDSIITRTVVLIVAVRGVVQLFLNFTILCNSL